MKRARVSKQFRDYMRRMKSYVGEQDPLRLLQRGPGRLERTVRGLKPAQLRRRPQPGKWSIHEILGHLADTEIVYGWRLRMMLAQPGAPIQVYDQDKWANHLGYQRQPASKLVEQVRVLREANLRLLKSVPRKWWSRYGMHQERGRETVGRMLVLLAGHDVNHLRQVRAIRRRFNW